MTKFNTLINFKDGSSMYHYEIVRKRLTMPKQRA